MINSLSITRVECSRGISDAAVYILDEDFSENEKRKIISELKKSGSYIARYCTATGAIAKMPKMTFCFDDSMEKEKRLTEILEYGLVLQLDLEYRLDSFHVHLTYQKLQQPQ